MKSDKLQLYRDNGSGELAFSTRFTTPGIVAQFNDFMHGDDSVLNTPGLIEQLAHYIFDLYHNGDMQQTLLLLERLGETTIAENLQHREYALIVLSLVAAKVLEENNEDLLEAISLLLVRWLKNENEYISGFEYICLQLGKLIQKMLEEDLWYQAEDLVTVLSEIKKGTLKKHKLIRQIISRTHSIIAQDTYLDQLTSSYVANHNDKSDVAATLLVQLGEKAAPRMLQTLSSCEDKEQRLRLIDLIPATGIDAIPSLVAKLRSNPPWYVSRNILLILSRIADPAVFEIVKPFIRHQDLRVQQEAVRCIAALNGEQKVSRLLEALNHCDHRVKPLLINLLGPLQEERVGAVFLGLLNNVSIFESALQNSIIQEICKYLPAYSAEKSFAALETLVANQKSREHLTEATLKTIEETCTILRRNIDSTDLPEWVTLIEPHETETVRPALSDSSTPSLEETASPTKHASIPKESWFSEVATSRNISAELQKHLHNRADFYTLLSHEEFLVFSALLTSKIFRKNEPITAVGDVHSTLFFIEDGGVQLTFPEKDTITSIKTLEAGDLFGHEIFMNGSEWPVALKAVEDTTVLLFDQEQLLSLQPGYPDFCRKFLNYCRDQDFIMGLHRTVCRKPPPAQKAIPFTGDIGDHIADSWLIDLLPRGFCFCFTLPQGIDYSLFADRELHVHFSRNGKEEAPLKVQAQTIGLNFFREEERRLCIFARFRQAIDPATQQCVAISL
ncbi:MAG: HEAT repeat domain-containing protein [Desulfopila sp.]|nr:HEAT repeat domain-containing protein [Desulfopila sp.]